MKQSKTSWGIAFPIIAVGLLIGAYTVVIQGRAFGHPFYISFLPWAGLIVSLLSFVVGHISYPRIHNLKVFLTGYLIGLCSLAYFAVCASPDLWFIPIQDGFVDTIYLLVLLNLIAAALVPSFVKYNATKFITWSVAGLEAAVLILAAILPAFSFVTLIAEHVWIGPFLAAVAIGLTIRFMRNEFHLGGLIASTAILYGVAWVAPENVQLRSAFEPLLFTLAVVFLELGLVFHWFVRMEHRIAYDPLLHIYNRDYCGRILAEQSKLNSAPPFTIAMVDIDHFKKVNDTHGHQAGDIVLYHVAQTLSRAVVPSGTLCRYGGEELAVFFPNAQSAQVKKIMENARELVEKTKVSAGRKTLSVTVSIGVATRSENAQSMQEVLEASDKALYRAKQGGRNQVRVGSPKSKTKS